MNKTVDFITENGRELRAVEIKAGATINSELLRAVSSMAGKKRNYETLSQFTP